jgi:phosphoglycolate phosphatase
MDCVDRMDGCAGTLCCGVLLQLLMPNTPQKLVLFDIDGTLVRMQRGLPRRLFEDMTRAIWNREISLDSFNFAGRTDRAIIAGMARMAGVPDAEHVEHEERAMEWIETELRPRITSETLELLPSVKELLEELVVRDDVVLAVLTGNLPGCAESKLSVHDLHTYFLFGVYGKESHDRNELGPIAIRKAKELTGIEFSGKDIVIIGDTMMDLRCAQAIDAKCIITLTGRVHEEELHTSGADFIFDDLSDTEAVIRAIFA